MSLQVTRKNYTSIFGPTVGDQNRLGDTTVRDGMCQSSTALRDEGVLDFVICGATIIDHWGIVKADIGIKDGRIIGIGRAGNPDITDNITPQMIIGASTEVHGGHGYIVTAGGIDTNIHFISPTQMETALYSGVTTMIGGGTGPADGTNATTVTPGKFNIKRMLQAAEAFPVNVGFFGKGNVATEVLLQNKLKLELWE